MAYKSPGVYARFVKAPVPVADPSEVRVMAIVGTGENAYDKVENVLRESSGLSDKFSSSGVYDVKYIQSKPRYQGKVAYGTDSYVIGTWTKKELPSPIENIDFDDNPIEYYWDVEEGHCVIKDGQYIVWKSSIPEDTDDITDFATITKIDTGEASSLLLADQVNVGINIDSLYLLKDGVYRIEVTYVDDSGAGMYVVVNELTQEVIGEYVASDTGTPLTNVIPGLMLRVDSTKAEDGSGAFIDVNDYILIKVESPTISDVVTIDGEDKPSVTKTGCFVEYSYKKPRSEYVPKVFRSYDDVVKEYGNYDIAANGKVINSLSLAAEIAMLNGASPIVCVQVESDTVASYTKAIETLNRPLLGVPNVNAVVALTSHMDSSKHNLIVDELVNHVKSMSSASYGRERIAYVSHSDKETFEQAKIDLSVYNPLTFPMDNRPSSSQRFSNERVVYVFPQSATKDIKDLRTGTTSTRTIGSSYLATAVAALSLKNDPAEPLTNKTISGFKNLVQLLTEDEMNALAENGVLVLKQHGETIKVRHGLTTSSFDLNASEITLVQIKDYVMETVRTKIGEKYIGNKLLPGIVSEIESSLVAILNSLQGRNIILGHNIMYVKKSSRDMTQIDIKFEVEAVYPLNYIDVEFSFSGVN